MQDGFWDTLTAPFPETALEWRVVEQADEGERVKLRPQLPFDLVLTRLDGAAGRLAWSNRYLPWGETALCCELTIGQVTKSVVLSRSPDQDAAELARDALVQAAERFGLCPPADPLASYWALADSDTGAPIHEPEVAPVPAPAVSEKSAGQQAIDRLIDRLRQEGQGLAAAQLITEYQGYGNDPEAARELYARLRALLLNEAAPKP